MTKIKLLVENFFVYGLGGIANQIIPLIMIPIITRLIPDSSYYGISDLSNTIIQFGSALAVMGMYDAMYRMFFEKEEEEFKKKICSSTLIFTIGMSVAIFLIMVVFRNKIAQYFLSDKKYAYVVYLSAMATLVGATHSIIAAPTRMQNKRKIFLIANIVSPLCSYSIAIPLILAGYYVLALPLAMLISSIILESIFVIINRSWFNIKYFDKKLLKQLLIIAIPLFPNFIVYWIFNSCDKIMITNILGVNMAGIYSIGSKLGHASQLIYTAFAGGWQYFAFSTMRDENQIVFNSKIFEYLGVISFIATSFMCVWSYSIFHFLFTGDYTKGFIVAPYLFLAPLLQMLFQIAANQFLILKKTWPNLLILFSGAVVNVILNVILIPLLGIEGAAIATLIGYFLSIIICVCVLNKMNLMYISKRFIFIVSIIALFFVIWRKFFLTYILLGNFVAAIFTVVCAYCYKKELIYIYLTIKKSYYKHKNA